MKKPYNIEKRIEVDLKKQLDRQSKLLDMSLKDTFEKLGIENDKGKQIDIQILLSSHRNYVRALDNYFFTLEK
jgi:hypothetical protein